MVVSSRYNRSQDAPKVLIFDWDDTLCCSSFFERCQVEHYSDLPANVKKLFNELAKTAEKCLHEASKYGEVIIITNSDDGWVKYSCERYIPQLLPVIEKYRVVSARTRYERFYPNQPLCWKAAAFAHEVSEMFKSDGGSNSNVGSVSNSRNEEEGEGEDWPEDLNSSWTETDVSSDSGSEESSNSSNKPGVKEVISFGDSMEERTAVRIVAEQLSATPKSVMFITAPSPMQIIGQLNMLANNMSFVCCHETSLDLEISPEQAERCASAYLKRHHKNQLSGDSLEEITRKFTNTDMESCSSDETSASSSSSL